MIEINCRTDIAEGLIVTASEKGEVIATLRAEYDFPRLVIKELDAEGVLVDGLCRAALNYAVCHGVSVCDFSLTEDKMKAVERFGFVKNDNNRIDDIGQFFSTHRNCEK